MIKDLVPTYLKLSKYSIIIAVIGDIFIHCLHRLQRKNSLVLQAMESWSNEFDSLLGRLGLARHDIDQVLSFLPCFKPQHSEKYESSEKGNISATLHKQSKVVPEERKDFGDMEELD